MRTKQANKIKLIRKKTKQKTRLNLSILQISHQFVWAVRLFLWFCLFLLFSISHQTVRNTVVNRKITVWDRLPMSKGGQGGENGRLDSFVRPFGIMNLLFISLKQYFCGQNLMVDFEDSCTRAEDVVCFMAQTSAWICLSFPKPEEKTTFIWHKLTW